MKIFKIQILTSQGLETARLECDRVNRSLTFIRTNGLTRTYISYDFFGCFGALRSEFSDITFLCKGSKLNVHPSRMSSQMSHGLVAYELRMGTPSSEEDIVRIFDYDDTNLTNNIGDQKTFYLDWVKSLQLKT
jgi:hypothetical protein